MSTPGEPGKPAVPLDVWREALTAWRGLSNDLWRVAQFFLAANGLVLGGLGALFVTSPTNPAVPWGFLLLAVAGAGLTGVGIRIHHIQRNYYCEAMRRVILLESQLGVDPRLYQLSATTPWPVSDKDRQLMLVSPEEWRKQQLYRPGTVASIFRWLYVVLLLVYLTVFIVVVTGYLCTRTAL